MEALSDRMKGYEACFQHKLPKRTPVILRVDGRAFHTLLRGAEKPFDISVMGRMWEVAKDLCEGVDGARLAFTFSDEVSVLVNNYGKLTTEPWFDNKIQKMVSISAAIASLSFGAEFDSRIFVLPKEEVCNYFIWRQRDAERNSVRSIGQAVFSHKEMHKLRTAQVQEKLRKEQDVLWSDLCPVLKRGACVVKKANEWEVDVNSPRFSQDRNYIEQHLLTDEEREETDKKALGKLQTNKIVWQ